MKNDSTTVQSMTQLFLDGTSVPSISYFQSNCMNKIPAFAAYLSRLKNKIIRSDKSMLILLFECSPNCRELSASGSSASYSDTLLLS